MPDYKKDLKEATEGLNKVHYYVSNHNSINKGKKEKQLPNMDINKWTRKQMKDVVKFSPKETSWQYYGWSREEMIAVKKVIVRAAHT
jgi:hypothetical protein